jgi:hypothetical protein
MERLYAYTCYNGAPRVDAVYSGPGEARLECPRIAYTDVNGLISAAGVIAEKFTVDRFGKLLLTVMRLMPPPPLQGSCANRVMIDSVG